MVCKLAVLLAVAIFAVFVQVTRPNNSIHQVWTYLAYNITEHSQVQGHYDNDDVPLVRNDAEKLLHKLEDAVDKALVQAQEALDDAKNKVNEVAEAVEASAEGEMQSSEEKFKEELDELKAKAAKAGVNIDECLNGNEDKLVNLPNVFTEDMVHCVSDRVNEGISYAQDALDKVNFSSLLLYSHILMVP